MKLPRKTDPANIVCLSDIDSGHNTKYYHSRHVAHFDRNENRGGVVLVVEEFAKTLVGSVVLDLLLFSFVTKMACFHRAVSGVLQ